MDHYQVAMQEAEMRKGPWLEEEDERLIAAVSILGERRWDSLAKASGDDSASIHHMDLDF